MLDVPCQTHFTGAAGISRSHGDPQRWKDFRHFAKGVAHLELFWRVVPLLASQKWFGSADREAEVMEELPHSVSTRSCQ